MNNKLKELLTKWKQEFKADLLEGVQENNKQEYLEMILDEHFPIWIDEAIEESDTNRIKLYNYFNREFRKVI